MSATYGTCWTVRLPDGQIVSGSVTDPPEYHPTQAEAVAALPDDHYVHVHYCTTYRASDQGRATLTSAIALAVIATIGAIFASSLASQAAAMLGGVG